MSDYGRYGQKSGHMMAGAFFQVLKDCGSWADKQDGLRVALDFVILTDDGVRFLYNAYGVRYFFGWEGTKGLDMEVEYLVANWRNLSRKQQEECAIRWEVSHEAFLALEREYVENRQYEEHSLVEDARAFREAYEADEIQAAADYATDRGIKEFKENEVLVKEIPNPTNDASIDA